ncbi:MAG: holo-ACP synthase [Candidatus Aminicenantes bacterium]|nr:holo-ACP synthase [Candidatus Aminicenantes bacterium]
MIFGQGIDIIEVARIEKQISRGDRFKDRIFTSREREYCDGKKHCAQNYAARFAAKEAFFKALGTGWRGGVTFQDVEIVNDELGKPEIVLYGKAQKLAEEHAIKRIHVSLTHLKDYASSVVILEK